MPGNKNAMKKRAASNGKRQQTSSCATPRQKRPATDSNPSGANSPREPLRHQGSHALSLLMTYQLSYRRCATVCPRMPGRTKKRMAEEGTPPIRMNQEGLWVTGRHHQGAVRAQPVGVALVAWHLLTKLKMTIPWWPIMVSITSILTKNQGVSGRFSLYSYWSHLFTLGRHYTAAIFSATVRSNWPTINCYCCLG